MLLQRDRHGNVTFSRHFVVMIYTWNSRWNTSSFQEIGKWFIERGRFSIRSKMSLQISRSHKMQDFLDILWIEQSYNSKESRKKSGKNIYFRIMTQLYTLDKRSKILYFPAISRIEKPPTCWTTGDHLETARHRNGAPAPWLGRASPEDFHVHPCTCETVKGEGWVHGGFMVVLWWLAMASPSTESISLVPPATSATPRVTQGIQGTARGDDYKAVPRWWLYSIPKQLWRTPKWLVYY